jgi:hypothetical protein
MNYKPKIVKKCKVCDSLMYLCPSLAKTKTVCSRECNIKDIKLRKSFKGKKHTQVTKLKISVSHKGKIPWNKGQKGYMSGEKHHWFGLDRKGEKNPAYLKDRSLLKKTCHSEKDRRSSAYVTWRKEVWCRDNYKCKISNEDCNGKLEAHHILGYTEYPELRYNINNGITLCHAHHPRKRAEEKRLVPVFMELVSVLN